MEIFIAALSLGPREEILCFSYFLFLLGGMQKVVAL